MFYNHYLFSTAPLSKQSKRGLPKLCKSFKFKNDVSTFEILSRSFCRIGGIFSKMSKFFDKLIRRLNVFVSLGIGSNKDLEKENDKKLLKIFLFFV